jgi:hypothetical protein
MLRAPWIQRKSPPCNRSAVSGGSFASMVGLALMAIAALGAFSSGLEMQNRQYAAGFTGAVLSIAFLLVGAFIYHKDRK